MPLPMMRGKLRVDVLDDDRRKAKAELVQQEQFGVRHQRPPDRHHLLLPAGKRGRRRVPPFGQDRKEVVDAP